MPESIISGSNRSRPLPWNSPQKIEVITFPKLTLGQQWIIPNSKLVEHPVINWSHRDPEVRLHICVGASYESDPAAVRAALEAVASGHPDVLKQPAPEVWLASFGESALNFELLAWIAQPQEEPRIRSDLNYKIAEEFKRRGIKIPFPQRDVHIRPS